MKWKLSQTFQLNGAPRRKNQGLGLALRYGVLQCQYDIIARMDTDDLAVPDRFEKQLQLMEKEDLDLLGGHIAEFIDNPDEIVSYRRSSNSACRHCGLSENEKRLNHMTVMFKRTWSSRLATMKMAFTWRMTSFGSI